MSKKGGWGSLLSGAVAGLESRLDTILADDDQASQKQRALEEDARKAKAAQRQAALKEQAPSRPASRNRVNDRLQSRLARALEKGGEGHRSGSQPPSEQPSQAVSPSLGSAPSPRPSTDSRPAEPLPESPTIAQLGIPAVNGETEDEALKDEPEALKPLPEPTIAIVEPPSSDTPSATTPGLLSARASQESSRPSLDLSPAPTTPPTIPPAPLRDSNFLESEITRLTKEHEDRILEYQSELHAHLERIDALQSKLAYLAQQATATARAEADDAEPGSHKKKLAEKDEKIALLLEEGKKLSENEVRAVTTVRTLRVRIQEEEKAKTEWRRKFEQSEREAQDAKDRARRAEQKEKVASERLKAIPKLEQDWATAKAERDIANETIAELRRQLAESERRAEDAEKRAQTDKIEDQMRVVAELNDELSNARIEKRLIEDRAKAEAREIREESARQQEKAKLIELELKGEIQNLESKLEFLRSQSESLSSNAPSSAQTTLLRQIETLQTQYALATENWQGIESSLNARIMALEKDRDDIAKREADVRKKAREVNSKARRLEDELETVRDKASGLDAEKSELEASMAKLETRLKAAEKAVADARQDLERERKTSEETMQARLDEEKTKWRLEYASQHNSSVPLSEVEGLNIHHGSFLRVESPTASFAHRKHSNADFLGLHSKRNHSNAGSRTFSNDLLSSLAPIASPTDPSFRPPSRRTCTQPPTSVGYQPHFGTPPLTVRTPTDSIPPSRHDSTASLPYVNGSLPPSASATPCIDIGVGEDPIERAETGSSPHRTATDLISVSTVGAGPSVQLVERMSAAVRRLESEKAASKEEMARLTAQRDEAREEVVRLMREIDEARQDKEKLAMLEKELGDVKTRYEASLEMLGEKSEEVEELRNDVVDLKKIYRELVESTLK